jgi:inorganic triphosphatase YgiF
MAGAENTTEVELTLRLDPKAVSRLLRDPLLRKLKHGPRTKHRLVSTYFDTADFRLQRERGALRVREVGTRRIQTLKFAPKAETGVRARREWERELEGKQPDLRDIDDRHVRKLLDSDLRDRLEPIFVTEILRSTVPLKLDGSAIELAVDVGEIKTERGNLPVCEAELELKSGRVESVYKLAQELTKRVPMTVEPRSKSERGYALVTDTKPGPLRARGVRLAKDMPAGAAFQVIARNCLLHLRANEASVRSAAGADSVHQLRVAVRRLRSALVAFGDLIPKDERRRVSASVRWIAQQCGRARELDVFQADVMAPLRARLPDEQALAQLAELIEAARSDAYANVAGTLESKEYTDALLAMEAWVEGERWHQPTDADIPVRDFARAVLKRLHRKLTKGVGAIDKLDEAELHRLRINAKKLRYASEFFRGLFPGKAAKAYLGALMPIQDRLGTLNDGLTARQLVASFEGSGGPLDERAFARASGVVLGWNACRISADLKRLPAVWETFRAAKPFWK